MNINIRHLLFGRRYLTSAVLMLIVALGIGILTLTMQVTRALDAYTSMKQEQVHLVALHKKMSGLDDMAAFQSSDARKKIDLALPSQKPLLQLLNSVNSAAEAGPVTIVKIETSPGKLASSSAGVATDYSALSGGAAAGGQKINGVDILQIQVTIKGTLAQINGFVDKIETSVPITDLTRIRLASAGNAEQTNNQFEANLTLTSFYFTQPIVVALDTPLPETNGNEQEFLKTLDTFSFPADKPVQETIQGGGQQDLFGVGK